MRWSPTPPLALVAPDKQVRMAYLVVLSSYKATCWTLGGSCRAVLWGTLCESASAASRRHHMWVSTFYLPASILTFYFPLKMLEPLHILSRPKPASFPGHRRTQESGLTYQTMASLQYICQWSLNEGPPKSWDVLVGGVVFFSWSCLARKPKVAGSLWAKFG